MHSGEFAGLTYSEEREVESKALLNCVSPFDNVVSILIAQRECLLS
jgi:hypothetical protein